MEMFLKNNFRKVTKYLIDYYSYVKRKKNFYHDLNNYNQIADSNHKADTKNLFPCLYDATNTTEIEPVYFYQDAWAFERILQNKPENHVDVGSGHKYVSFLSKITNLTMVDIRPLAVSMDSIYFKEGDILDLPFENRSIESLSSLCVIEHIGLGRYGDKIDPYGSEKAFKEIDRVLKNGANLYFSVPVEYTNKTYFNAHRAFSEEYLFKELLLNYTIVDRKYIYGNKYCNDVNPSLFGIGCYHLKKKD